MDFPKQLKQCQRQRHMTNREFAKYIGKSRTWLQWIYSNNPNVEKFLLSEMTMYDLHEKLEIPNETMEEYNKSILANREQQKEDGQWAD